MPRFGIVGCAGYVAPRHLEAIREVGGDLIAALDPSDSVGVLDSYFPEVNFFTESERFDRYLEKLRLSGDGLDYVSICSPNYLHDAHVRLALRSRANAICEKPLVLSPWNLDALASLEQEYDRRVSVILQLRLLKDVETLRQKYRGGTAARAKVKLTYVTTRGPWYHVSWKGQDEKSGGVGMNIGVHLFDLLIWVFGRVCSASIHERTGSTWAGQLVLESADVDWMVSVDAERVPVAAVGGGYTHYRTLEVSGEQYDLSRDFHTSHIESYRRILNGTGFGIEDARSAIELVERLRRSELMVESTL